ncbi:hypothetical protein [Chitinophaga flava]|uniref:Uncharacterized protein n=1 Tax=Chitinophaga flava TaxID=2259036 RepID=A0A365XUG1_9BACT|nr:hypothetical protein [Chitinophaga flava]RBL89661.1 hypothetical protein DF182_24480 [Chitinophaga flava]
MKKLILGAVVLASILTACSKKDKNNDDNAPQPVVAGKDSLTVYKDLEFDNSGASQTLGVAFSTKEGKMYNRTNLPKDGKSIDLVYAGVDPAGLFFSSPDAKQLTFDNATTTLVMNLPSADVYDPAKFDTLSHGSALNNLAVKQDGQVFPMTYKGVVLFRNAAGKNGVIKITYIDAQRIQATIKVQP